MLLLLSQLNRMNRILRHFSVLNKIKNKEKLRQGSTIPRCPTHLFNDQPTSKATYESNRHLLSPAQQYLIETKAMERPYTGNLWSELSAGFYHCAVCDLRLFTFNHKYQANTGYASFWRAVDGRINTIDEEVLFDEVNEARPKFKSLNPTYKRCQCAGCSTHLGAVFFDGPPPTFLRYTINSSLIKFYDMPDFPDPNPSRREKQQAARDRVIKYLK